MPLPTTFTLGLVQVRCDEAPAANLERALTAVRRAGSNGAQIICLPELFGHPYFCQTQDVAAFDRAEPIPGPTCERLAEAAKAAGAVVVGSVFERRAAGTYHSTAVVFDADGSLLGGYRKMHVPDTLLADEKFYFTPGDKGWRLFKTRFGRIGVLLSWDQWFPEAARLLALRGADALVCPAAFAGPPGPDETAVEAWEVMLRSHAVANGLYVAAVNRVGQEGGTEGLRFWGSSLACGPDGGVLGRASEEREEVLVVPCDRRRLEQVRRQWPFFRDRRTGSYRDLSRRWLG
jgi:N-carbamoylputrescine amidase